MAKTAMGKTEATVPATVATIDTDHVVIRITGGGEHKLAIEDVPEDLLYEGQAVSLIHNADGFVFGIVRRIPAQAPPDIQKAIEEAQAWADRL